MMLLSNTAQRARGRTFSTSMKLLSFGVHNLGHSAAGVFGPRFYSDKSAPWSAAVGGEAITVLYSGVTYATSDEAKYLQETT